MERLEEIQNELALEMGFKSFTDMDSDADFPEMDRIYNLSAIQYAKECCKATLEKADENNGIIPIISKENITLLP